MAAHASCHHCMSRPGVWDACQFPSMVTSLPSCSSSSKGHHSHPRARKGRAGAQDRCLCSTVGTVWCSSERVAGWWRDGAVQEHKGQCGKERRRIVMLARRLPDECLPHRSPQRPTGSATHRGEEQGEGRGGRKRGE
ncbi:hypothetical protein E2C01_061760 [Portunus trituberculatus]|uniref:Uncharacterized protein n=1 Tax=Portunus trituberculatus TaxID=210409 RepID=A0A5B7HG72_PORTR|nr:hypothetical protein [Portunus trituberculatus]